MPVVGDSTGEARTSLERRLLLISGLVTVIGGIVTGLWELFAQLGKFTGLFGGGKGWKLWVPTGLLLMIGLWLIATARRRRSRLRRPDALRLDRANPDHLIGREDAIETLAEKCRTEPIMFLVGESGAGKSALVQAGLVPRLNRAPTDLLPIYVDSLIGSDWEQGPRRALGRAIRTATAGLAGAGDARSQDGHGLRDLESRFGRIPFLIFDQFDDYQSRYRDKFLQSRTWIESPQLIAENEFWAEMAALVSGGTIHILIVTRSDTAAGLASVRFGQAKTFNLEPVGKQYVAQILDRLLGAGESSAIEDPEHGWTRLRPRLVADLERGGAVLPQQLKVVLAGLSTLPQGILTVAAYEKAGEAGGLEARFIEDRIATTARASRLAEEKIRAALMRMVDDSGSKTVEVPQAVLAEQLNLSGDDILTVLEQLEDKEILRRLARSAEEPPEWQLDHDYLARAVLKADSNANRWQRTLKQGAEALEQAEGSWVRKWRALLPPMTQLHLAADRIRRRFRYGAFRSYAIKSTQRFAPAAVLVLLLLGASLYESDRRYQARLADRASPILNAFDRNDVVSDQEPKALLLLGAGDPALRHHVLQSFLTAERSASFIPHADAIVKAVVGTSPDERAAVARLLSSVSRSPAFDNPQSAKAIARAATAVGRSDALEVAWWLRSLRDCRDDPKLFIDGLGAILKAGSASGPEQDEIIVTYASLLSQFDPDGDTRDNNRIGIMLREVPDSLMGPAPAASLSESQGRMLVEPYVDIVETVARLPKAADFDPNVPLYELAGMIGDLPANVRFGPQLSGRLMRVYAPMLSGPPPDGGGLFSLVAHPSLRTQLDAAQRRWIADVILTKVIREDPMLMESMDVIQRLAPTLEFSAEQKRRLLDWLLPAIERSRTGNQQDGPSQFAPEVALQIIASFSLSEAERRAIVTAIDNRLLASLSGSEDFESSARWMTNVPPPLEPTGDREAGGRIAAAFTNWIQTAGDDPGETSKLAGLLADVPDLIRLSDGQADLVFSALLAAHRTRPSNIDGRIASGLKALLDRHRFEAGQMAPLIDYWNNPPESEQTVGGWSFYQSVPAALDFAPDQAARLRGRGLRYLFLEGPYSEVWLSLLVAGNEEETKEEKVALLIELLKNPLVGMVAEEEIIERLQTLLDRKAGFGKSRWKAIEWLDTQPAYRAELRRPFDIAPYRSYLPESWEASFQ